MSAPSRRPEYLGEPTLAQVMRRPTWILALLLALVIAGTFAWLGQWQMSHAIRTDSSQIVETEEARPLTEAANTAAGVTDAGAGVVVTFTGSLVPGDFQIITDRMNAGERGAWVVGHLITGEAAGAPAGHLAVALGWAPDVAAAQAVIDELDAADLAAQHGAFEGRYMPSESAVIPHPKADPQAMTTMVPAHLVNNWSEIDGPIYAGYAVLHDAADATVLFDALDPIDSAAPSPVEAVNWLNVFYAIEWIVFAGFAVFFWFRLARDAWEKEHEMQLLIAAEAAKNTSIDPDAAPAQATSADHE